jgi:hypothetical protein
MQLAITAKNTSDNVTGSLSYINDLVTGATEEGLYKIFVGQQFLNDSMVADLIDNYGYDVYQRNVTMGTNQEYIISWVPEATPVATHIPSPTPTPTPSPTASSTPTPTPIPQFGDSGFQWMTINSITDTTASGIGQNGITIAVTQSGGGMEVQSSGMVGGTTFPQEYGVPITGTQIRNTSDGVFTATFSQPVLNPLVAFASVGNPSTPVPVIVSAPFTPIWGLDTTYQNQTNGTQYTQFTGSEGYNIIRIDGTVSSVSFNYTVTEYYCTVCFGFVNQNNIPTPTPTSTPTPTPTSA